MKIDGRASADVSARRPPAVFRHSLPRAARYCLDGFEELMAMMK